MGARIRSEVAAAEEPIPPTRAAALRLAVIGPTWRTPPSRFGRIGAWLKLAWRLTRCLPGVCKPCHQLPNLPCEG